jgi:GT2 family glycosyltransferase/glycosyltransferase involved in cell wall biosynthesis
MRSLFAPRPSPYYIFGFNYRRSSAGIRVMHMLCDALIRSGYEAYVMAEEFSPDLMTPKLTNELIAQHRAMGIKPIAVYPEVVDGNPLQGSVVVRYLLNKPGFISGKGEYGENDLLFAYKQDFMQAGMPSENHLFLPAINSNIFRPAADLEYRMPGRVCYYLGHKRHAHIDPQLLPADAIEITLTYPDSWEGLADIFQQCEYLYLGEASGLAYEAALCGCLPVLVTDRWSSIQSDPSSFVAFGLDSGELARVRSILPGTLKTLEAQRAAFWPELDRFIRVTQAAIEERKHNPDRQVVQHWLKGRTLNQVQQRLVEERKAQLPALGITAVLFDPSDKATTAELQTSFASLIQWQAISPGVLVRVVSAATAPDFLPPGFVWDQIVVEPVAALNQALAQINSEWLLLLTPGDELLPTGTLMLDLELAGAAECRMVFTDAIYRAGGNQGMVFRPDFNLDYLLSLPAGAAHHWLFRRDTLLAVGGFDPAFIAALEFEMIVRLIEQDGMSGIGHVAEPLLICETPALRDNPDEVRVLERHLLARGYEHGEVRQTLPGHYHLYYGHAAQPLVSILVPTKDQLPVLRRCIESLLETTRYTNYEVIVIDNNSETPEAIEWLAQLALVGEDKVRVLSYPQPFNFSAINNVAAQVARGEYLVLLNNDTAIISPDWLDELLNHAQRPEVGIVGAKLLFPDKRVQHAGVILGLDGPAEHPFIGEAIDAAGYMQRLQVDQNYSAVTAACLMIRRSLYFEVGGMDEAQFAVSYNDIDLCLKAGQAGYLIVWTPHAVLMHEGSVSQKKVDPQAKEAKRKRFVAEQDAMYAKWLPKLARDPAYNSNLSLVEPGGFKLADNQLSWRPLAAWRPLPTVLAHPADLTGCGQYRVIQPFNALQQQGFIDGGLSFGMLSVVDLERYDPDVVLLQRQIGDERLEAMRRMQAFSRAFKVYELDDYLPNLPMKSAYRANMPKDILRSLRRGISYADRFVVSTQAMAEAFEDFHPDIRVVKNRLDPGQWRGLRSQRRSTSKPRVGWAGGVGHAGDLEMLTDVIKALASEVEWVFFGMCPDQLRPYIHEFHPGVAIEQYPLALAGLNLDLALAPVEQNLFNECKSNLRLLEYGACGFPVICSDVRCYQDGLPVTRVKNRFKDWLEAIRMHLADLDAAARMGDELRAAVNREWMLEGQGLEAWRKAWLPD